MYLDTSIFGGYFDPEFELWTRILFDGIRKGHYIIIYSKLTDFELNNAPQEVRMLLRTIPLENIEFIDSVPQAEDLADQYIREKVVGETSRADCLHIALATLNSADMLLSWNFKHIVNVHRIRGYNHINSKNGYKILEIRTPREILEQ